MDTYKRLRNLCLAAGMISSFLPGIALAQPSASLLPADLVHLIDAANQARYDNVLSFTDTEHYALYRGNDEAHAAAEMTVKMTYRKGEGKSYQIVSQSGSQIIQKFGLEPLLENEKAINDPARVQTSWFTSTNYDMQVKAAETRQMNDATCVAVTITPKHTAPNMIDGKLWIDPRDGTLAQVEGAASRSPSIFAGTTHMMRQYTKVDGFAMATHARAESHNALFGRSVVTIDYSDYKLELRPSP
jgi:hypothetical protein